MPTCGTALFSIVTFFIFGLIIGALIILCLFLRGVSFKKKYGFKEEPYDPKMIKPSEGSQSHMEPKETIDGSNALKDFKK